MPDYEVSLGSMGETAELIVRAPDEEKAQEIAVTYATANYDILFGSIAPDVCAEDCAELPGGAEAFALEISVEWPGTKQENAAPSSPETDIKSGDTHREYARYIVTRDSGRRSSVESKDGNTPVMSSEMGKLLRLLYFLDKYGARQKDMPPRTPEQASTRQSARKSGMIVYESRGHGYRWYITAFGRDVFEARYPSCASSIESEKASS